MPLFDQDPAISRRFGLGLGAGLLNTHGRPAGAILSDALMLGQKNADTERKLRVDDAQARYYGARGQIDLFGVAKDLHAQRYARWQMLKRASMSPETGVPDPGPPPDIGETMQQVFAGGAFGGQAKGPGVMAGPQGMPAGQPAPIGMPGGSGQPPGPPSAPSASQPPSSLIPGAQNLPHHGPPGQPEPLGPASGPPVTGMDDPRVQPLQRNTSAAAQQLGAAQQAALRRLQGLQAWGMAEDTDVSGANAMAPKQVGQFRHDPVTNQWVRDDPEGMVTGPDGRLMNRPGHVEATAGRENFLAEQKAMVDAALARITAETLRQQEFGKQAGQHQATAQHGAPAAAATAYGTGRGTARAGQEPSMINPNLSNDAAAAIAKQAGQPFSFRGPQGETRTDLQGNVLGIGQPGAGPGGAGVQVSPTTQQARVSANVTALDANDRSTITKRVADETTKGQAAGDMVNTIRQARAIMPQSTGKAFEALLPVGQWLASINVIPQSRVREIGNAEGFRGLMSDALVGTQAAFKGSVSNVEFTTARETLPTLGTTRLGNEFLLDFYQAVGEKQIWYTNQVNRINQEFTQAQRTGQEYDLAGAMAQLDRLVNSEATSVYNQPGMARWAQHLRRGAQQ